MEMIGGMDAADIVGCAWLRQPPRWYPPGRAAMVSGVGRQLNDAGTELVENLVVLRGRLARGQHPDHGRALARRLAVLLGVRRRPHLRGRFARPRPALR